jgi:Fur family ferric uptake transcriptional regulator
MAASTRSHQRPPVRERDAWRKRVDEVLGREGHRAGGARKAVVELLADEGGCVDADVVTERLRERGERVGTASVYRALGLLTDLGLLQRVTLPDGPARFELVLPGGHHHHHLVCDRCGRTVPFSDEPLEQAIDAVGNRSSFDVSSHEIVLRGECERCRGR